MLFPSGRGPAFLQNFERYLPSTVFLLTEPHFTNGAAHRAPYFSPFKDVVSQETTKS